MRRRHEMSHVDVWYFRGPASMVSWVTWLLCLLRSLCRVIQCMILQGFDTFASLEQSPEGWKLRGYFSDLHCSLSAAVVSKMCCFHHVDLRVLYWTESQASGYRIECPRLTQWQHHAAQGQGVGLSGKCELFSAKWKFKMRKNTPKFFQKMQKITQNAGKIRSVAMAISMAAKFWTGKLVLLLLLLLLSTSHSMLNSCQCPRTGDEGRKPTTAKQKAKTKSKKKKN